MSPFLEGLLVTILQTLGMRDLADSIIMRSYRKNQNK